MIYWDFRLIRQFGEVNLALCSCLKSFLLFLLFVSLHLVLGSHRASAAEGAPKIPRFSIDYMDKSVDPAQDFYHYAVGTWLKSNPVPPDKSRWASFTELQERNWYLIHEILDTITNAAISSNSPKQKVRDFFLSAMDTNRLESLGFKPIQPD